MPNQNIGRKKLSKNTIEFVLCWWSSTAGHEVHSYMVFVHPVRLCWRKQIFPLQAIINWIYLLGQGQRLVSISHLSSWSHLTSTAGPAYAASLCEFICVSALLCLEGLIHFLDVFHLFWLLYSLPLLLQSSLNPQEEGLVESSHLGLIVPRSLNL